MQEIVEQETQHGPVFRFGSASFVSFDGMAGLGGEPLRQAIRSTASVLAQLSADMLPERIGQRLLDIAGPTAMAAAGDGINLARRAKSDAIIADARQNEPARPLDPVLAIETRSTVLGMDAAAAAAWVEHAGLAELTAVVDGGNRANLPLPIYDRARERYWVENWIARHNAQAEHPTKPSIHMVLATGPDDAAVRAEAESYHAAHVERMAALDDMEFTAKSLIAFLAAVFGVPPSEALDRAMGRFDAAA